MSKISVALRSLKNLGASCLILCISSKQKSSVTDNTPQQSASATSVAQAETTPAADLTNQAPVTTAGFTSFQDTTPVKADDNTTALTPLSPYPKVGMEQVCERLMRLSDVQWSSAQAPGTIIGSLQLPINLLQVASLWCKLSRFEFFRANIEVQMRLNTTKFHYGQLMAYIIPDTHQTEIDAMVTDIWTASMLDPKILLANSQTSITFTIPFQHQFDWISTRTIDEDPCSMAYVGLMVLQSLGTASNTTNDVVSVTTWARFTDIEIGGPISKANSGPTPPAPFKPKVTMAPVVKPKRRPKPESSEQLTRSANSSNTGADRLDAFKQSITSIPIIGGLASAAFDVLGDLTFSKPSNVAAPTQVVSAPDVAYFKGSGLQQVVDYGLTMTPHLSDDQKAFGKHDPCCYSFRALAQKPSLLMSVAVPVSTEAGDVIFETPIGPFPLYNANKRYDNWFAAAARSFMFWRGSVKYLLLFSCSSYTSARVRIEWLPKADVADSEHNEGDTISQVVDICGDTNTKVTVPFFSRDVYTHTPRTNTDTVGNSGFLRCTLLNAVSTFDESQTDPEIQLSVFVAAGPDIDFTIPYVAPVLTPVAEGDLADVFATQFPAVLKARYVKQKGVSTSESDCSIRNYARRWFHYTFASDETFFTIPQGFPQNIPTVATVPSFWDLYRFKRGSMRIMPRQSDAVAGCSVVGQYALDGTVSNDSGPENGYETGNLYAMNYPSTVYSMPYTSNAKFVKKYQPVLRGLRIAVIGVQSHATPGTNIYLSAGDDLSFGGLGVSPTLDFSAAKKSKTK